MTLDYQPASETCQHCDLEYPVSRGSVYREGRPIALYLAGMHACEVGGSAILAIAFPSDPPVAASVQVWAVESEFQMQVLEPNESPWTSHAYLGRMLSRSEALVPAFKTKLFQVADCIAYQNPTLRGFFAFLDRREHSENRDA